MFKSGCLLLVGVSVIGILALLIYAMLPAKEPKSIHEVSEKITSVSDTEGTIKVRLFEEHVWTEKTWVTDIGNEIIKVGKYIGKQPWDDRYKKIVFIASAPAVDRYGNEKKDEAMTLVFSYDDFKQVNWPNFYSWDVLNLASEISFHPLGRTAAKAYCRDENHAEVAKGFCLRVLTEEDF